MRCQDHCVSEHNSTLPICFVPVVRKCQREPAQLVDKMASEQRWGWWSWKGPAETGDKEETGDLLGLVWEAQRAASLRGTGLTRVPLRGERHQNKELPLWPRGHGRYSLCSLLGIYQLCRKHEKELRCFVAKGGDRDIKTDAAGCRKNNQAIYTHTPFRPIVGTAEAEGGFWFQGDL